MFKPSKRLTAAVPPFEYYGGTENEELVLGEALKLSSGKLTKASGTDKPEFLCQGPAREDGLFPVLRLTENLEFEALSEAVVAESLVGTAVALASDGLGVTATAGGCFQISGTDGDKKVTGYFVKAGAAAPAV